MSRPNTLFCVAERVRHGIDIGIALPEFVDEFLSAGSAAARLDAIREEPALTGNPRIDALLAAVAEYLAKQHRLPAIPSWVGNADRRLPEPWFTTDVESDAMREYLAVASPAEFRHHNIFTEETPLRRTLSGV